MPSRDRRLGFRVPLEIFLNQYIRDRPFRALTCNLSDTGVYLHRARNAARPHTPQTRVVSLEFELPGTGEIVWARGEIAHEEDEAYVRGAGVRFTAMAQRHARLIRDYCVESRHGHLAELLEKIRNPPAAARA
jgi:c-di-GMP-binding flagellar brake protein YcgR